MSWSSYADEKMEFLIVRNREALKKKHAGVNKKGDWRPFKAFFEDYGYNLH